VGAMNRSIAREGFAVTICLGEIPIVTTSLCVFLVVEDLMVLIKNNNDRCDERSLNPSPPFLSERQS
jgi:hypothetical protein